MTSLVVDVIVLRQQTAAGTWFLLLTFSSLIEECAPQLGVVESKHSPMTERYTSMPDSRSHVGDCG